MPKEVKEKGDRMSLFKETYQEYLKQKRFLNVLTKDRQWHRGKIVAVDNNHVKLLREDGEEELICLYMISLSHSGDPAEVDKEEPYQQLELSDEDRKDGILQ